MDVSTCVKKPTNFIFLTRELLSMDRLEIFETSRLFSSWDEQHSFIIKCK